MVLSNLSNPTAVAIDGFRNYVFVAQYNQTENIGTVNRYNLYVNITNATLPIV
jgi:hypothetical protein